MKLIWMLALLPALLAAAPIPLKTGAFSGNDTLEKTSAFQDDSGLVTLSATGNGKAKVSYFYCDVPVPPTAVDDKMLVLTGFSDTPEETQACYLRLINKQGKCLASFRAWGNPLKNRPQTFKLTVGQGSKPFLNDREAEEATDDRQVAFVRLLIGTREVDKPFRASFRDIKIVPTPASVSAAASILKNNEYLKKLNPDHPRLFFNKEMIPAIRAAAAARPEYLKELKGRVDPLPADAPYIELTDQFKRDEKGHVTPNVPSTQGYLLLKYAGGSEAGRAALLYLITREKQYRDKAIAYLKLYPKALEFSRKGYWYLDLTGHTRINAMLAYDILYHELTPAERREIMMPLVEYTKDVQPKGKLDFRRTIGSPSDGNYGETALEYFLGVTLYGDGIADKEAETMLKRGAALFVAMLDFRDDISDGSGLLSSLTTGYSFGNYPTATHLFFHSWKSAFGEDISDRWTQMLNYHRFVEGMIIKIDPEGNAVLHGIGDTTHIANRILLYNMYGHIAQNIHFYGTKHPEVAEASYRFLAKLPKERQWIVTGNFPMYPFLLTGFDPAKVKPGPGLDLPYFYSSKFGFLAMWSGRGPHDTYASFRFGSEQGNHQHYDELSFVIYKNDFLALDAGSRSEMDHHHNFASQTVAHNSILIHMDNEPMAPFWKAWSHKPDGKTYYNHGGQNDNKSAKALALQSGPGFIYAAGDATGSYDSKKSREVVRQFVFLKPDTFVIYDRVESAEPGQKKEFLLHTQQKPESVAPGVWRADQGEGRLFVQTLLPLGAKSELVGGPGNEFFASGRNWPLEENIKYQYAGNWRLEVSPKDAAAKTRFLHVLQTADKSRSQYAPAKLEQTATEDVVRVNGFELRFRRNGEVGLRIKKGNYDQALPNRIETMPK